MKQYPIYDVDSFSCGSVTEDFYVNTLSNHLKTHSFVETPHRHSSYLLLFFTHGSGKHEVDFDRYEVVPGSIFALQPGQLHHWDLSRDVDGYVVIYAQELYNLYFGQKQITDFPFYQSAKSKPEIVLGASEIQALLPFFELLRSESTQNKIWSGQKMLNLLDCIHIEMTRHYAVGIHETHPYNTHVKKFEQLLELYFRREKLPSFYADKLHITLKHLNRICNEMLQKTATEVIAERLILEAKRMLTDPNLSVNAVADTLGFDDYSYFSRFFKKQAGMSPSDFRRPK